MSRNWCVCNGRTSFAGTEMSANCGCCRGIDRNASCAGGESAHVANSGALRVLPWSVDAAVMLVIGIGMAVVSFAMVKSDAFLTQVKLGCFEKLMSRGFPWAAIALMAGTASAMVALVAVLVTLVFPLASGSGLPEIKGYLNGNTIPRLFGLRRNWVRAVGAVLATAAGLATGREGPLVSLGGAVGVSAAQLFAARHFRRWVKISHTGMRQQTVVVDEHRFAAYKRSGCVMGSAAGLAAAFYAPLGGFLYIFEEATSAYWGPEMTFRTFTVVFVASFSSRAVLNIRGSDWHQLVIFQNGYVDTREWFWADVPVMFVVSVVCGLLGVIYSAGSVLMWRVRSQRPRSKMSKIVEAAVYAGFSAAVMSVVPMMTSECQPNPTEGEFAHEVFLQYLCPDGTHNELATLLLQGAEGTIKHMYTRSGGHDADKEILPLFVCAVVYFVLAMGVAGLAIPAGNFIPSMFIGAVVGRFLRQSLALLPGVSEPVTVSACARHLTVSGLGFDGSKITLAQPGVYAVIGSGAFLGAFMNMTVAVVALLVEATRDIKIITPLMFGVFIGRAVSKALLQMDFCERLIVLKGVPFLEPECPRNLEEEGAIVGRYCDHVEQDALLQPRITPMRLRHLLRHYSLTTFPIVDPSENFCVGLVPRSRLVRLLELFESGRWAQPLAEVQREPTDWDEDVDEQGPSTQGNSGNNAASVYGFPQGILAAQQHGHLDCPCAGGDDWRRACRTDVPHGPSGVPALLNSPNVSFADQSVRSAHVEDGTVIEEKEALESEDTELRLADLVQPEEDGWLSMSSLADPVPYSVPEDMPISLVYPLFARAAAHAVIVTPMRRTRSSGLRPTGSTSGSEHFDQRVLGILERRHIATHSRAAQDKTVSPRAGGGVARHGFAEMPGLHFTV